MLLRELVPDIEVSTRSIAYKDEIFGRYEEIEGLPKSIDKVVIHLYPVDDTTKDGTDDLKGYEDALFFSAVIYMPTSKTFYKIGRCCDAISVDKKSEARIFKDGSTMITVYGPLKIGIFQRLEVISVEK